MTSRETFFQNLPELPSPAIASASVGDPVEPDHLVELLTFIDPAQSYPLWRDVIAAVRATNAGDENDRFDIADKWSRGDFAGHAIANYDGPDPVNRVWATMAPRVGGLGYGSLLHAARAGGYAGDSAAAPPSISLTTQFGKYVEPPKPSDWRLASDTLAVEVGPVQELVPGLIERGIVTFLNAPGGTNKSRLAIQWGLCIDSGLPVIGRAVQPATFIYLSWEDHADEVTRRMQKAASRLHITAPTAQWRDLTRNHVPLAIIGDTAEKTELYLEVAAHLKAIPGHKFIVVDSTYDALMFVGNAKVNEASVMAGIAVLQDLCNETDSTLMTLWHPSQSGQDRGDAGGWSVAWHNKPRAKLALKADKDVPDTFYLSVEKRNNAPRPRDAIVLHWSDGLLLPVRDITTNENREKFRATVLKCALDAATAGTPLRSHGPIVGWVLDELTLASGRKPSSTEVREMLATLAHDGKLTYQKGYGHKAAGYVPPGGIQSDEKEEAAEV